MSNDQKPPKTAPGVSETGAPFETTAKKGARLKVRRIGNSLGVVLPKEVLAKLRVGEGEFLSVTETPEGVALSAYDEELKRQLEAGRKAMGRYRNALRELAK